MDNKQKVLETLKQNGMMRPGEIAEKSGIEKTQVEKAIKELKAENKISSPKRCFYAAE